MSWQDEFEKNIRKMLDNPSDIEIKNTIRGMTWIFHKEEDRTFIINCLDKIAMEWSLSGRNEILKLL